MSQQTTGRPPTCPPWCTLGHGVHLGEEDLVHISRQHCVRNTLLRICCTLDPETGEQDGPYLLLGAQEFSLEEVDVLVGALTDLAEQARGGHAVTGAVPAAPVSPPAGA